MGFQDTGPYTMNIEQLKQLIQQGESQHLEFKKSTAQLKPAFETACAFLNDKGGVILLGVKDNGQLVGQAITDQTRQLIAHEIRKIEPKSQIEVHYVHFYDSKYVIILEVPSGKHTPYAYDGRPFERSQSTTERMTQHRYEQLIVQRGYLKHNWIEFLTHEYTIEDLDHDEIRNTVAEGILHNRISPKSISYSIEQILTNFNLMQNNSLTNAAVILFCKSTKKFLRAVKLKWYDFAA